MGSKLDQLKTMTDVVADTGDIEAMRRFAALPGAKIEVMTMRRFIGGIIA